MPSTPPYPEDFRRDAVALVRSSEKSIPVLARELGVSPQSLRNWAKQTQLDSGVRRDGLTSEEREELRRLRRENRRLEQQRDILKSHGLLRQGERGTVSSFRFIAAEKANHPVSLLCAVLGVSRSGFHAWQKPLAL